MSDAKTRYPIPVITASSENYDAMLRAEHVLIVAHDVDSAGPGQSDGKHSISERRCLIRCGAEDVFAAPAEPFNAQKLRLMVGG